MHRNLEFQICPLDRWIIRLWIVALFAFFLSSQLELLGQTDCASYNQCPELQGEQNTKLRGNITYSFDEASLALLSSEEARQNFRNAITAAANDWAQRTGRSISGAPSGQTGT